MVPVWFHVVPTVRIFMEKFVWLKRNADLLAWFLRGSTWFLQRVTNTSVDFPSAKRSLLACFLHGSMWFLKWLSSVNAHCGRGSYMVPRGSYSVSVVLTLTAGVVPAWFHVVHHGSDIPGQLPRLHAVDQ